jgi:hypothetical protein
VAGVLVFPAGLAFPEVSAQGLAFSEVSAQGLAFSEVSAQGLAFPELVAWLVLVFLVLWLVFRLGLEA